MRERSVVRRSFGWILVAALGLAIAIAGNYFIVVPAVRNTMMRKQIAEELNGVRQLQVAIQMMTADNSFSGDGVGPADKGIKTFREFLNEMVRMGYLKDDEVEKLHLENFALTNFSSGDSPDTTCIVSRELLDPTYNRAAPNDSYVVFDIRGAGTSSAKATDRMKVKLPTRTPQILPTE